MVKLILRYEFNFTLSFQFIEILHLGLSPLYTMSRIENSQKVMCISLGHHLRDVEHDHWNPNQFFHGPWSSA